MQREMQTHKEMIMHFTQRRTHIARMNEPSHVHKQTKEKKANGSIHFFLQPICIKYTFRRLADSRKNIFKGNFQQKLHNRITRRKFKENARSPHPNPGNRGKNPQI